MDFEKILKDVYQDGPFTAEEIRSIFGDFFSAYKRFTGAEHPPLKAEQVRKLVDIIPKLSDGRPLKPSDYPRLIQRYFATPFPGCDYRIWHFLAGDVRDKLLQREDTAQRDYEQIKKVHDFVFKIKSGRRNSR